MPWWRFLIYSSLGTRVDHHLACSSMRFTSTRRDAWLDRFRSPLGRAGHLPLPVVTFRGGRAREEQSSISPRGKPCDPLVSMDRSRQVSGISFESGFLSAAVCPIWPISIQSPVSTVSGSQNGRDRISPNHRWRRTLERTSVPDCHAPPCARRIGNKRAGRVFLPSRSDRRAKSRVCIASFPLHLTRTMSESDGDGYPAVSRSRKL